MNFLLKSVSYLFHPVWMPFAGTLLYFLISPRFFPFPVVKAKILAIAILSVFIPIVFYLMLKTLGKTTSHFLSDVKERKWPLLLNAFLDLLILKFILDTFDYPELYYFFLGIFLSTTSALLLVLLKIKVSLHMIGLGGITAFLVLLSFHFNLNLIYTISFLIAMTGLTATSRLHFRAHTMTELVLGLLLGIVPQAAVALVWL
ncbi:MAG TPA: hypothetical protein ENO10_07180 [Salinimicrobium catena]|uniref:PAP2 superfamily protein n=1 Tax=Salinimicrobium catena TaxID=390640 RepID=A0A7C2M1A6_9FLAO|nr:hypothetical protein [Salinimicrobium catena]